PADLHPFPTRRSSDLPWLSAAGSQIEGALVRALAIRPDQRTQAPAEFLDDLRGRAHAGHRRYRPDEIDAIVSRAAEIDASNPTRSEEHTSELQSLRHL